MKTIPPFPDEFESLLAAQPMRPLPSEWREEILSAARQSADRPQSRRLLAGIRLRHGWAALAAVWLVLAALHFDTPPAPAYTGSEPRPIFRDFPALLAGHQAEIARLIAAIERHPTASATGTARGPVASPESL